MSQTEPSFRPHFAYIYVSSPILELPHVDAKLQECLWIAAQTPRGLISCSEITPGLDKYQLKTLK